MQVCVLFTLTVLFTAALVEDTRCGLKRLFLSLFLSSRNACHSEYEGRSGSVESFAVDTTGVVTSETVEATKRQAKLQLLDWPWKIEKKLNFVCSYDVFWTAACGLP